MPRLPSLSSPAGVGVVRPIPLKHPCRDTRACRIRISPSRPASSSLPRASEIDLVGGRGEGCWIGGAVERRGVGGGQCVGTQARVAVVTVA